MLSRLYRVQERVRLPSEVFMSEHYRKWRRLAPLGLGTVGFGASLLGYAVEQRTKRVGFLTWFAWGTLSLVVLNSGLAIFGEAVKHRALLELKESD